MHLQRLTPRHGLGSMPKRVRRALLASRLDRADSTSAASAVRPRPSTESDHAPVAPTSRSVRGCGIPFGTTISGTSGHAVTHVLPPTCLNHVMRNLRPVTIVAAAAVTRSRRVLELIGFSGDERRRDEPCSGGYDNNHDYRSRPVRCTGPTRVRLSRSSLRFATAATAFTRSRRRAIFHGDLEGKHVSAGVTALDATASAMR